MNELFNDLSPNNADQSKWVWDLEHKAQWRLAGTEWRDLYQEWYGHLNRCASPVLAMHPHILKTDQLATIFIRDSYQYMFDTIWEQAMAFPIQKGVIITGQPGTGKTLLLYYLLVRFLQLKQVILFSPDGRDIYLFYHDGVYNLPAEDVYHRILPMPVNPEDAFIWSLFDVLEQAGPVPVLFNWPCFPVQTASPCPARYKIWSKDRGPLRTGLPLWSKEELMSGLKCQTLYQHLTKALQMLYSDEPVDLMEHLFSGARPLLEAGFAETANPTPEEAMDFLLDEAIDRFGYSARDVFDAVFNYTNATNDHLSAFGLGLEGLESAVSNIVNKQNFSDPTSHRILALSPVYGGPLANVSWKIDFKSDWVNKNIIQRLSEDEKREIYKTIRHFTNIPQAKSLAGRFFEPVAHQHLTEVGAPHAFWALNTMTSNNSDAPRFTLASDILVPASVKLAKSNRQVVQFTSLDDLPIINNSYYIPTDASFPFFDSFSLELDFPNRSGILWVFQITTSRRHGGSRTGYVNVRKIIGEMKKTLKQNRGGEDEADPSVKVRYVLIVPSSEGLVTSWYFPSGWNKHQALNDHRGEVYCLELPLTTQNCITLDVFLHCAVCP